ncbi:hypothetical protein FACS1894170_00500 [Planctomycetales bacterium]|nr:hypothetical protein FACS1894170_00500 [Planctomycetales bacterium]
MNYAYNGSKYQWYSPERSTLTFSAQCRHPTPYWIPSPLIYPYHWLAGQQANWSDIKNPEKWEAKFKEAKYVGKKSENGIDFEVISFPYPQDGIDKVEVYFAKELEYYPLKSVFYKNAKPVSYVQVLQYKAFDIDGSKLIFPQDVMVIAGESENEGIRISIKIKEDSIEINPQIDEDLFTISPTLAKTVVDFDQELESGRIQPSNMGPDGRMLEEILSEKESARRTRFMLTVAGIHIIGLALLFYFLLRKKKSTSRYR